MLKYSCPHCGAVYFGPGTRNAETILILIWTLSIMGLMGACAWWGVTL